MSYKIVRAAKNNINRIVKVYKVFRASGTSGTGLPVGGTVGQMIRKTSSAVNYASEWFTIVAATVGLGNVTDDAQLKRSAGDFQAFTQKITPAAGDSIIIEDGSDGQNKKRVLIDLFLGGGGAIDYANPTAANSTGTITPTAGEYFTSTSKLVTLVSNDVERFLPYSFNDSGITDATIINQLFDSTQNFDVDGTEVGDVVLNTTDTTRAEITSIGSATTLGLSTDIMVSGQNYEVHKANRVLWGTGPSAAATLTVDPSSLSDGEVFAIELQDGESRIIMWDGTDFHKVGGVVVNASVKMFYNGGTKVVVDNTSTLLPLDLTAFDNTNQMADPTINKRIDIIRSSQCQIMSRTFWNQGGTQIFDHETQSRVDKNGSTVKNFFGFIHAGQQSSFAGENIPFFIDVLSGDYLELNCRHQTVGGTETLNIFGAAIPAIELVEVNPW